MKRISHLCVKGRKRTGTGALYLLLALGLGLMFMTAFYGSLRAVQESVHFGKSLTAYYAAEAGLEKILSQMEQGYFEMDTLEGRVGSGVYLSVVTRTGDEIDVYSRGWFKPRSAQEGRLLDGATHKVIIHYKGRLNWGRVIKESWEKYP